MEGYANDGAYAESATYPYAAPPVQQAPHPASFQTDASAAAAPSTGQPGAAPPYGSKEEESGLQAGGWWSQPGGVPSFGGPGGEGGAAVGVENGTSGVPTGIESATWAGTESYHRNSSAGAIQGPCTMLVDQGQVPGYTDQQQQATGDTWNFPQVQRSLQASLGPSQPVGQTGYDPGAFPGQVDVATNQIAPWEAQQLQQAQGSTDANASTSRFSDPTTGVSTVPDAQQRRKRRNRWGPVEGEVGTAVENIDGAGKAKKRRSRWETNDSSGGAGALTVVPKFPKELTLPGGIRVTLPPHLTGEPVHTDPELKELHERLAEVNRKIHNNELDLPPEHERSPSPEPIYDKLGIRLNTREVRYKEKLVWQKNDLIEELIKKDSNFKPPADYKPQKKARKIYIPQKDFPGYNFIGLIIGPRGNTQKRMQKETNTKIAIRGRGSVKEGAARDPKYDYGEDEELHVLITGDKQEDVDQAANMIEKLLQPVDEERNEHKRMQLRELAALNGTLKDDQTCYLCGDSGHRSYECPKKAMDLYKLPTHIQEKVDEQYQKDVARVRPEEAGKLDNEYKSFLMELGGGQSPEAVGGGVGMAVGSGGGMDGAQGQAPRIKRPGDDMPDDCKLYVGNLSLTFNDTMLRQLFEHFGEILHATVLMDLVTGTSRGYGFVHFTNNMDSKRAAEEMNSKIVDGRALVVRLRSEGPPTQKPKYGAQEPDDCKLYVAHLPLTINETALRKLFEQYGPVGEVKLITDRVTGQVKGYGFVNMASPQAAQAAIQSLNGYRLEGKTLTVRIAGQRPPPGAAPTMPSSGSIRPNIPAPAPPPMGYSPGQPGVAAPAPVPMAYPPPVPPAVGSIRPQPVPTPMPPRMGHVPPSGMGAPQGAVTPAFPPPVPQVTHTSHYLPPQGQLPPPPQGYVVPQQYNPPAYSTAAPPPLPQAGREQPPPPSGPPPSIPPPPPEGNVQSEYERFMQEMQGGLPS